MDLTTRWSSQQQTPQNSSTNPGLSSILLAPIKHQTPPPSLATLSSHLARAHRSPDLLRDLFLSFPQPVIPPFRSSNIDLHPPGTDASSKSSSNSSTHVGLGPHFQYSDDQNASLHSWAIKQAKPVRHEPAIYSWSENSNVSTSSSSLRDNLFTNQSLGNDASVIVPRQAKVAQSIRCEICRVNCNSKDVYETHILGKKHKKNLQERNCPVPTGFISDMTGQMGSLGAQTIFGTSGVAASEELEIKKRKLLDGGAAVDSIRVCSTCNVACNSQQAFDKHLAGEKHAKARIKALDSLGPHIATIGSGDSGSWRKCPKENKVVQSAWCEVCKISCNSSDMYIKHLLGKKHQKKLVKLSESKEDTNATASNAPLASTYPESGPTENRDANEGKSVWLNSGKRVLVSRASEEDVETKIRKIWEGGVHSWSC